MSYVLKTHKILPIFMALVIFIIILMPLQEAHAVVATITSADVTSATTVTIVFSVSVDFVIGDFTDLNVAGEARTVDSIAESAPGANCYNYL